MTRSGSSGRSRAAALLALAVLLAACTVDDASPTPERSSTVPVPTVPMTSPTPAPPPAPATTPSTGAVRADAVMLPEGFSTATVRITAADGSVCEVCMWLADDQVERGRGLMEVTDLGPAAGMVFAFQRAGTGSFYMYRTVTALSIAWFAPDGSFVSSSDMEPCVDTDPSTCPRYAPSGSYDLAIEVVQGDLAALGIGPGSRAQLVSGTEAPQCDTPGA